MSTVNFRMVRLAREMRSISQARMASETGISQAVLSRIEGNLREPTAGELERFAQVVDLPVPFFLEPEAPAVVPMFRKRVIRSAATNRMIQARINVAVLAARRILDAGVEIDTPFTFPAPGDIPREDPVEAGRMLRRGWRMPAGRVDNMTQLIEGAGGIVIHVDFGTDDASAAFAAPLNDSRLWFVVNTREVAGDRVRLSLAHELGHAVMHRLLPAHDERQHEREAFSFALAFLLPPDEFDRAVPRDLTLGRARDLKRAYWVSIQAIIKAARDRELISQERYQSLYKQISARGWRTYEPDPLPVETPTTWTEVLALHRRRHGYTDDELAILARLTPSAMSELFPRDFATRLRLVSTNRRASVTPSTLPPGQLDLA